MNDTAGISINECDRSHTAVGRTLEALVRAPGTVRFSVDEVVVTLDLTLPPQPHERIARGLEELGSLGLRFSDGSRRVVCRLPPGTAPHSRLVALRGEDARPVGGKFTVVTRCCQDVRVSK